MSAGGLPGTTSAHGWRGSSVSSSAPHLRCLVMDVSGGVFPPGWNVSPCAWESVKARRAPLVKRHQRVWSLGTPSFPAPELHRRSPLICSWKPSSAITPPPAERLCGANHNGEQPFTKMSEVKVDSYRAARSRGPGMLVGHFTGVIPGAPPLYKIQVQRLDMGRWVDRANGVACQDKVLPCGEIRSSCLGLDGSQTGVSRHTQGPGCPWILRNQHSVMEASYRGCGAHHHPHSRGRL